MDELLLEYLPVLIFIGIALVIAAFCVGASWFLMKQRPYTEKASAYECGLPSFGPAYSKFEIQFYLVAILFIIFDLEVAFLFPWAVSLGSLNEVGMLGFWSMLVFLAVLTIGFVYEWKKGALEWE